MPKVEQVDAPPSEGRSAGLACSRGSQIQGLLPKSALIKTELMDSL